MPVSLIAVAVFLPLLSMLVVIHELGHYFAAKLFKVKVLEIGLGYPPRAFAIYRGRTMVRTGSATQVIDLETVGPLRPGQLVRVLSTESDAGELQAGYIERVSRRSLRQTLLSRRRSEERREYLNTPGGLAHQGRIRSVSDDALVIADTAYSLNWLPLGGFVTVPGENNPETPRGLACCPAWQRIIILSAGSAMNAVFPIVAFTLIHMLPYSQPTAFYADITAVNPGSPAERAGLLPGDRLLTIDGDTPDAPDFIARRSRDHAGQPMTWLVRRDESSHSLTLTPHSETSPGQPLVGVHYRMVPNQWEPQGLRPPWEAAQLGAVSAWKTLTIMGQEIRGSISARVPEVSGPIGIAHSAAQITQQNGFHGWLAIAIILSINLAIINILPIPMLDGGRLLFVLVECVRGGKRVPPHREHLVHMVGFMTLIALLIVVSAKDIVHIAQAVSAP